MSLIRIDVKKINKNERYSRGTCVKFVWTIIGTKILIDHISVKKEDMSYNNAHEQILDDFQNNRRYFIVLSVTLYPFLQVRI